MEKCPGCGAEFTSSDGPNHKYFGESPACWKTYGEILTREYEDVAYWKVHRLTVDAYASQHCFNKDRRNIQSVNIHLMALHAILDLRRPFEAIPHLLGKAADKLKGDFTYLEPPQDLGPITVKDVISAQSAYEHEEKVWAWARSVWSAWSHKHSFIQQLLVKTETLSG